MAFADTANLVVQLRLDDKISAPLRGVNTSLTRMGVNTRLVGTGLSNVGKGLALGVARGAGIAAVGLAAVSTQVVAGVRALQELEDVQLQTEAALESTGGAAGVTAKEVRALAEEYETLGGVIDDKVIQSAENVLLTFTNVREKAFEPALQAALDLSTRLGTDLNGAVIQVGKALSDPVRGLTALRRVGVVFSADQEKLIRQLVEENDLFGAQQVILDELGKEFGGSFAARGRTGAATIARMQDAVEELQKNLATAFIPVIDKVARKLNDLFSDPEVIRGVRNFGKQLASFATEENLNAVGDGIRNVFGYLAQVPWGTIGKGLEIAGRAAKVAVDAFNALPPQVQGLVITLLAAQKLSGGLIGTGIGQIGKGLLGGLFSNRGATPATPVFTKEVGIPGAGGAPIAGGGRGVLGGAAKLIGGAIGVVVAAEIGRQIGHSLFFDPTVAPAVKFEESQFQKFLNNPEATRNSSIIQHNLEAVERAIHDVAGNTVDPLERWLIPQLAVLEDQRDTLRELLSNAQQAGVGNFVPTNAGGTPGTKVSPVRVTNAGQIVPPELFRSIGDQIKANERGVRQALKDGDIHQARILNRNIATLERLRGNINRNTYGVIPALGRVNRSLSVANRNLDDGNRRQREIADRVREARDRIGSGFQRSNELQAGILRKPSSFTANVTTNVTATLSTYSAMSQITRVSNISAGFTPNLLNG